MRYSEVVNFEPVESLIQLLDANQKEKAINLVKSYVMSDSMAELLNEVVIPQLQFDNIMDNKGIFIVGNYGTGKSHLMSVISSIAEDRDLLQYVDNEKFRSEAEKIAGKFEVLRIELGAVTTSLRDIILKKEIERDLKKRGIDFTFPEMNEITNNKESLIEMMAKFEEKYPDKGYLIVIDELLDFLKTKREHELIHDLIFLRELGEACKNTRIRIIAGLQESLFDSPKFSHVKDKILQIKDRYENIIIRKEDIEYVVSKRLLKKDERQKAYIRQHLQKFTHLYNNMVNELERFVDLYPIHPKYIEVFQNIYIAEHRQILKTISLTIKKILNEEIPENDTGIISYDSYWDHLTEMTAARTDEQIREVVDKSKTLGNIIASSTINPVYKKYGLKIIKALSIHRLTTGDIYAPIGLTIENIKDDLCLNIVESPEIEEEFLLSTISTILKEIIRAVSGQFISYNESNRQYYLDLKKTVDYQAKIEEKAEMLSDDDLNRYYFKVLLKLLEWENITASIPGHQIWEYRLLWKDKNVERKGYLFFGNPNERPTAQPPRDFYIYFLRLFEYNHWEDQNKEDEVFFIFNEMTDDFVNKLKLYAAANELANASPANSSDKRVYLDKAKEFEKAIINSIRDNILNCFKIRYKGQEKTIRETTRNRNIGEKGFKEIVDDIASNYLSNYFNQIYPDYPKFSTIITFNNIEEATKAALNCIAGKKDELGLSVLDSLGLLDGERIDPSNSIYAKHFLDLVSNLPPGAVINKKELFEKDKSGDEIDKRFKLEPYFVVVILASLVYSGDVILTDAANREYDSTKLNELALADLNKIIEFKYIKRPRDIPIQALIKLSECLGIPGHIKNPDRMIEAIADILKKVEAIIEDILRVKEEINKGIYIWDYVPEMLEEKDTYLDKLNKFKEFLDSLKIYNTPAKLKSFKYTAEEIEENFKTNRILKDIKLILEFREKIRDYVDYLKAAEAFTDDSTFKEIITEVKNKIKEAMNDLSKLNEDYINEILEDLKRAKKRYKEVYIAEHRKYRLDINEDDKKAKLLSSKEFDNLRKLCQIKDIFNSKKFDDITNKLSSALTCYSLTDDDMERNVICPHCKFNPKDNNKVLVDGLIDSIEDEVLNTLNDWEQQLLKALEDSIIAENMKYLKPDEKREIEEFISNKKLPEVISSNFINAINQLMEGFDKIELKSEDLKEIIPKGPITVDEFKDAIDKYINNLLKGKQKDKVRILIR
jgi:hypothetical protein